jgi:hypothetical protein
VVFPDAEDSIWTWDDEKAGQYYLHHFYSHQPDLNIANPAVRDEIAKIAGFWLELGVDGFRVDAVPFLLETGGIDGSRPRPARLPADLRSFIARRKGDAVLLGEVNLPTDELVAYFGDDHGDELQMLFDFPVMQQMYLALARRTPGRSRALEELPEIPDDSQWAIFVRNHDELTLDQLSDDERQEVFDAFGPDETCSCSAAACAAACRRCSTATRPDPDGLQPAVQPARHAGAVLRRGDRDGREPRHRGPPERAHADAVDRRPQRRVLDGPPVAARRPPRGRFGPARRQRRRPASATPTRCSTGWSG